MFEFMISHPTSVCQGVIETGRVEYSFHIFAGQLEIFVVFISHKWYTDYDISNQIREYINPMDEQNGRILIYQNEKGDTKIDVFFEDDTVWMTQKNIGELYQTTPQNITLHIKNIYQDGELEENSTCKNYLQVQKEGTRDVKRDT